MVQQQAFRGTTTRYWQAYDSEVNAIAGSAVALLAYQIQRLEVLTQSAVVLRLDRRIHGNHRKRHLKCLKITSVVV